MRNRITAAYPAPGTCGEYERVKGLAILNALYTLGLADDEFQLSC